MHLERTREVARIDRQAKFQLHGAGSPWSRCGIST
jgi:hypothetical protein